jgi:hypothetical protein
MAILSRTEFETKTKEVIANINDLNETIAHYAIEKTVNQVTPAFKGCRFFLGKNGFTRTDMVNGVTVHSLETFAPDNKHYLDLIFS